jgi:N-acetylmuramoyl-L-alanine amidase
VSVQGRFIVSFQLFIRVICKSLAVLAMGQRWLAQQASRRNLILSENFAGSRGDSCSREVIRLPAAAAAVLMALTFGYCTATAGDAPLVSTIRVEGTAARTQVVAEVSAETGFTVKALPNPYRVVIDVPDVQFDLPSGVGRKKRGLVQQIRYGKSPEGQSQIVIDTTGPVLIEKSFAAGRSGKRKARIVVELAATTPELFARALVKDSESTGANEASSPEFTASLPLFLPRWLMAPSSTRKVIVIDPGHGGIDPGAVSPGRTMEKDVVFAFAQALKEALDATGQFDVKLTRDSDTFVSLRDRVKLAHEAKADLFIAVHADTVRGQTVTGTTLYTLSEKASDAEAEALAQKENRVDVIAGLDLGEQNPQVADILIDLVQRESKNHAVLFSRTALDQLHGITTMTGKPLRSAGFMVLKAPDIPSVLIELGYLSSKEDEKKLLSAAWRRKMSGALTRAVVKHFADSAVAASSP